MTSSPGRRAPGRPVDLAKRGAVIAAAWELFLAHGVDAVAMEAVAAAAGVSKVTLYRHFADKASLLEAGVLVEMERIEAAQGAHTAPPDGDRGQGEQAVGDGDPVDLRGRLRRFGLGIAHFLASDNAVAFYSTLAGELSRHPDLARRFWDAGPGRTRTNLTRLIAEAADSGELDAADPRQAADHLFGLWQGFSNFQLALGVEDEVTVSGRVEAGIEAFLRAYGPDPSAGRGRSSPGGPPAPGTAQEPGRKGAGRRDQRQMLARADHRIAGPGASGEVVGP